MGKLTMEESLLSGELGALMRDMTFWSQDDSSVPKGKSSVKPSVRPLAIRNTVEKPAAVVDYEV